MTKALHDVVRSIRLTSFSPSILGREKGVTYAFIALLLPVILGFVALITEMGMVLEVRRELQTAVDAAALAGARELPESTSNARNVAEAYVDSNGEIAASTFISFSETHVADDTITVGAVRNIPLVLMPILGFSNSQQVAASATAAAGSLGSECVLPMGIIDPDPYDNIIADYEFGEQVQLEVGHDLSESGNFHLLRIYGPGNDLRDAIAKTDCAGNVGVGAVVETEPGESVGNIRNGFQDRIGSDDHSFEEVVDIATQTLKDPDCPRLGVVPVLKKIGEQWNGVSEGEILGFALFFIEHNFNQKPPVQIPPVIGRFIKVTDVSGSWVGYNPWGPKVVRLLR